MILLSVSGRLTGDVKKLKTKGDTDYCRFTVANNDSKDNTVFVDCTVFNGCVGFCTEYLKKGTPVIVAGVPSLYDGKLQMICEHVQSFK